MVKAQILEPGHQGSKAIFDTYQLDGVYWFLHLK